uniref:Putative MAT1-2-1 mating type protein n=1 Tax=Icmadophila splachnirima TaxID=1651172 RepID=A0A0U2C106_9LECA|nr:putative MAT1-2-1 mating type protein [Knightiella splachnirima]
MVIPVDADHSNDPNQPIPALVNDLWLRMIALANSSSLYDIHLPASVRGIIGTQGLNFLATNLISIEIRDAEDGTIWIGPSNAPQGRAAMMKAGLILGTNITTPNSEKKVHTNSGKKAKVPRPPNAFILYRQQHHPLIRDQNPGMHNNQISVILGAQWRGADNQTRQYFQNMAKVLKIKHLKEHPEYSYQPRKPSEKKRRTGRKKAGMKSTIPAPYPVAFRNSTSSGTGLTSHTDFPFPDVDFNEHGGPVITIGDPALSDDQFLSILRGQIKSLKLPTAPPAESVVSLIQRTEEAQVEANLSFNMINWSHVEQSSSANKGLLENQYTDEDDGFDVRDIDSWTYRYDMTNPIVGHPIFESTFDENPFNRDTVNISALTCDFLHGDPLLSGGP